MRAAPAAMFAALIAAPAAVEAAVPAVLAAVAPMPDPVERALAQPSSGFTKQCERNGIVR